MVKRGLQRKQVMKNQIRLENVHEVSMLKTNCDVNFFLFIFFLAAFWMAAVVVWLGNRRDWEDLELARILLLILGYLLIC